LRLGGQLDLEIAASAASSEFSMNFKSMFVAEMPFVGARRVQFHPATIVERIDLT